MVEVFKTDVKDRDQAKWLVDRIHEVFADCKANFDLDDCDHILRVQSSSSIQAFHVIDLLEDFGYRAEILSDEELPARRLILSDESFAAPK